MKALLPPRSHRNISRKIALYPRSLLAVCLLLAGLVLAATSVYATINHPPFVSWIPDQRITSGKFARQYFRILEYDGNTVTPTVQSTNPAFYSATNVAVAACTSQDFTAGCANDGTGYKVTFSATPTNPDTTTITITAQDNGGPVLSGYTSFTLRLDAAGISNPPSIGILPNQAIQINSTSNTATYTTKFVIGDLSNGQTGIEDVNNININTAFTKQSDNPTLLPPGAITIQLNPPDIRSFTLTATTPLGMTGHATVWIDLMDPDGNVTTTSFVLQVFPASNAPPSISNTSISFEEQVLPATSTFHSFTVANDTGTGADLKVSAFSSNTKLVPNDFANNLVVTQPNSSGVGSVTITPLPLPSPSPGVPQSSTITLSVSDEAYTRQATFLYVVRDPASPAAAFSRPTGVFVLNPDAGVHRSDVPFITGEMHGFTWRQLEPTQENFVWTALDSAIDTLPILQQDLSLNLQQEPCYIAQQTGATWCDTNSSSQKIDCGTTTPCTNGVLRAVPWDSFLMTRRDHFLQMLAGHLSSTGRMGKVSIINPNLRGADTGIRNVSLGFDSMPGYSRPALLAAVQDELRTVQDNFPGKLVQIGFFPATDNQVSPPLWQWLYRDASNSVDANGVHLVSLFDEFNGIKRPRVSFFQENLAATRTTDTVVPRSNAPNYIAPSLATAYTFTPMPSFVPSFAYYSGVPTNDEYNNGTTFQSNTPWSHPFTEPTGLKLIKTINGSPNDGMEGAFNAFLSQYLEIYLPDIDQAQPVSGAPLTLDAVLWAGELKSWYDYTASRRSLAPIENPAGLTVVRSSPTNNAVSWYAVYGATSYTLQRKSLGGLWTNVAGCNSALTACTDTASTVSPYFYQVRATNANGAHTTPWSQVAVFLSESTYDGYVSKSGTTYTPSNNVAQPGIRAGEGAAGAQLAHQKGFLSFNTGALGSATTIRSAKLRLNQATAGTNFALLGPCMVDISKGSFNGDPTLTGTDYTAGQTTLNAFPVINVGQNNWFTAELTPSSAMTNISNTDHTQFRIYFTEGSVANRYEGWYSGESSSNNSQPQLIVQYQ